MTLEAGVGRSLASDQRIGGSLLFIAGGLILMGIVSAEALYLGA